MKKITIKKRTQPSASMNSIAARLPEQMGKILAATSSKRVKRTPTVHIDDIAADKLAAAMKETLARCRTEDGKRGWDSPLECSPERLATLLGESLVKGNPVHIANFAAFLFSREVPHQAIATYAMRALLRGSIADQTHRIDALTAQLAVSRTAMEEALRVVTRLRPEGHGCGTLIRLQRAIDLISTTGAKA